MMINSIINASIRERFLVLIAAVLITMIGFWSYKTIALDAIPDLSDVQVIIFTKFPGQSPQVVEDQVTYPLTTTMLSVPKSKVVRGYSFFGLSFVFIIFEDGTDMYWARSRVLESLNYVSGDLPFGVTPSLGPDATGVGWVYEYALVDKTGKYDLAQLRSIQDWYLRYPLQTVDGVAEVASVGGYVKQYQVDVNPNALMAYNIPLSKVKHAIKRSNADVGGRLLEKSETEYMVRSSAYIKSIEELKIIPIGVGENGTPILLQDVAHVHIGPELRRGIVDLNGEGEVTGGIVIMRYGENALSTIKNIRKKLNELKAGLPDGVEIITVYDRGDLIENAVESLTSSLLQEIVIVSIIILLFLFHVRSALVVIAVLPIGILIAFTAMKIQGINANIMSLGGIAITIGLMVDGAIVMVENAHVHIARAREKKGGDLTTKEHWQVVGKSSKEVGTALFFSLMVIIASFIPIFTMEAQEGRLFKPLAFTATYAMVGAAILAVTLVPVMIGFFVKGKIISEQANPVNRLLHKLHSPALALVMKWRAITASIAVILLVVTFYPVSKIGSEFMPPLDEGDILYMPTTFPGISITKSKEIIQQTDKILKKFPEVHHVFGKIGRAETATDSSPLSMIETTIRLKPRDEWPDPTKKTKALMDQMDKAINFPGIANAWTMPIKTRIDMLSTGIKTPVGIKVSGPDLNELQRISKDIEMAMKSMPETLSAFGDRAVGGYYMDFNINREAAARYGLTTGDVQDVIQSAIGGMNVTQTVEGLERYPVNLRYPRELRDNLESLKRVLIPTPTGTQVPLAQVAEIKTSRGAPVIKSEDARPNAWIYVDLKTSDIGGFVTDAKKVVAEKVKIPAGYTVAWSGQFEYMERANTRLKIVVPITALVIFALLYFNFRNVIQPILVMGAIPFGLIGGVWIIYYAGYNISVAVMIGFIALAGISTEISVLVLNFINIALKARREETGKRLSSEDIKEVTQQATSSRVRAVVMSAMTTMLGLIPIMVSTGTGSDVTQRIASPMLGGMITVMLFNLLVLPAIYSIILQFQEKRRKIEGK
tara:strand:+ start:10836 stop:13991 length:3156 start_codon:yes stop_codon:yes gene_type:complete